MEDIYQNTTDLIFNLTTNKNSSSLSNRTRTLSPEEEMSSAPTTYDDALEYFNMILIPICLLAGVLGNLITIILMNTKTFSKMASRYFLISLAVSDISVLCTQPFKNMAVIQHFGRDWRALSEIGCKAYFWLHKTGKMTSSWFVVCLCLERFVAVKFPFKVKTWFSKQHMLIVIIILYVVIGGFNAGYSYCTKIDENGICNPDVYDKNNTASVILHKHMLNVGVSLYFVVPLIVLFTLTPVIILSLIKEKQKRVALTQAGSKGMDVIRPTTMLITIMVTYILFVTPIGIVRIVANYIGINLFGVNTTSFLIFRDIAHILELINYTINFFLYVCSSKQFRGGFVTLLFPKKIYLSQSTR